jgi:hypothetical protein
LTFFFNQNFDFALGCSIIVVQYERQVPSELIMRLTGGGSNDRQVNIFNLVNSTPEARHLYVRPNGPGQQYWEDLVARCHWANLPAIEQGLTPSWWRKNAHGQWDKTMVWNEDRTKATEDARKIIGSLQYTFPWCDGCVTRVTGPRKGTIKHQQSDGSCFKKRKFAAGLSKTFTLINDTY